MMGNYQSQNNFGLLYRGGVPQITGMSNAHGGDLVSQHPYQTEFGNSFQGAGAPAAYS